MNNEMLLCLAAIIHTSTTAEQSVMLIEIWLWSNFTFVLPCIIIDFFFNNQAVTPVIQIYSVIKLYMFQTSSLPIIRSFLLYIWHWWVSCRFLMTASRVRMELSSILTLLGSGRHKTCMKLMSAKCTVDNSWWWRAQKMPETCRVL
jgi:hypothetical protein